MRAWLISPWTFRLWAALILFSQTGLAGQIADALVRLILEPGRDGGVWPHFLAQKAYHVVLFGGLGALLALRARKASRVEAASWLIGFSVFAESLQVLSPNRGPSPWDALLNIAAAAVAYFAFSARGGVPDSGQRSSAHRPG